MVLTFGGARPESAATDEEKEYRQRSFEGYITITKEYVNNGAGESIQGLIINELMKQNSQLQNQLWQHQTEKLKEKKERWSEVVGYIMNRGYREWRENLSEFKTRWNNWRTDARKMIADGEEWWKKAGETLTQDINAWINETTKASSKEAAGRIYNDLETRINRYETDIKNRMPGSINFDLDIDGILADAMNNSPVDSIGVLKNSMNSVDTTAGFTDMLNLGLSGTLTQKNEAQMKEYTDAMSVMSNLRVIDILNGIIEGFNTQLNDANKNVYDGVDRYIRRNETFISAPFNRNEGENNWSIRVCVESRLIGGDKYKTRTFADYDYYENETVYLKPVKGLGGTTIDFTDAKTYSKLDSEELDTYVGLETEWLNRSIEEIFKEGGTFSGHQEEEYTRIGDSFGKYYGDWVAGEALKNAGFYAKPIFPKGPNLMTTAAIAASMTGQVWVAALVAAASTGLQMADGTISFKHGLTQIGVGAVSSLAGSFVGPAGSILVNMAASGIDYEEGGGIGWSNKKFKNGVKSGAVKLAMNAALSYSGINATTSGNYLGTIGSTIVNSGLETDGHWYNIGFDTENWSQHITSGIAAGISSGVTGYTNNDVLGQMVEQGIMALGYNFRDGKGFKDDYGSYNWNSMAPTAQGLGSMLGNMAGNWYKQQNSKPDNTQADAGRMPAAPNDPIGAIDNLLSGLWFGRDEDKKFMKSITDSISGISKDIGLTDIFDSAAKVAGDIKTEISGFFGGIDKGVVNIATNIKNLINGEQAPTRISKSELRGLIAYNGDVPIGNGYNTGVVYGSPEYNRIMKELGYSDEDFQIHVSKDEKEVVIIENSNDGLNRHMKYYTDMDLKVDQYEKYTNSNGEIIKSSEIMYIYNGDSVDRVNRAYDASGENVYQSDFYSKNNQTDEFNLKYRDIWLRDESGNVMTDHQQGDYNFIMNNNLPTEKYKFVEDGTYTVRNNTSDTVGCLLAQTANFLGFMGLQNDPDSPLFGKNIIPPLIDNINDDINSYKEGSPEMLQKIFAESLELKYEYINNLDNEQFGNIIDQRIDDGMATIVYVPGHFVTVAGARYDGNGNITDYLVRNSSRNGFDSINRNTLYGSGKGRITSIGWYYR